MRLPRRVPWASISELEEIFAWIFGENADFISKQKAVHRLSAWRVATALPNALEATLLILSVLLQDENDVSSSSRAPHGTSLVLRQSYSLALIRFVNGLVDPLQSGVFARPIINIAAQIGIPLWMVELRHAGTHEDLPSLELLREGARAAMNWLLYNYFLRTISPHPQSLEELTLPPLSPLLLRYKQLSKAMTRDVTLKSSSKVDMTKILRDFDQWLAEANVIASGIFHSFSREEEIEAKERWSLAQLSDRLIGRGGLVPVAKSKRTQPTRGLTGPPAEYISVWSPVLSHLHKNHPIFLSTLLSRILSHLFSDYSESPDTPSTEGSNQSDPSFEFTLASWALWIIDNYQNNEEAAIDLNDVLKELLLGLGHHYSNAAKVLISELMQRHESHKDSLTILSLVRPPSGRKSAWNSDALQVMAERLSVLRPSVQSTRPDVTNVAVDQNEKDDSMLVDLNDNDTKMFEERAVEIPGWRRLGEADGWKPVPIGVFYSSS